MLWTVHSPARGGSDPHSTRPWHAYARRPKALLAAMSLQNLSKSAVRVGKNYLKGYTDTQIKVRDATSNDPWGPSGTQMAELAQLSHNPYV